MREVEKVRALLAQTDPARDVTVERSGSHPLDLIMRAEREPVVSSARVPLRRRVAWFGTAPRFAMGAAAAVAIAAAITVASVVPGTGEPAYAVTVEDDGKVRVEIEKLDDAAGFERALEEAGVPTQVEHLPEGKRCEDTGSPAKDRTMTIGRTDGPLSLELEPSGKPRVFRLTGFVVDPAKLDDDQTVVIEVHGNEVSGPAGVFVAETPYHCEPVDF